MPEEKRKVVYLFGTGASHALLKYYDQSNEGILMADIAEEVLTQIEGDADTSLKDLHDLCSIPWSENGKRYRDVNIENIITLYESSGTTKDKARTNKLRNLFRIAVNTRIQKALGTKTSPPDMIEALIDMYSLPNFDEKLCAILTLNYDNFIEEALIKNYGEVNFPFEVIPVGNNTDTMPVLCKLHGSFNWENTNPVKINNVLLENSDTDNNDILWVPPGVLKRNDYYPFNAIWGTARHYLKCDILRIIGCSLSISDVSVISLLHTTNRLRQDGKQKYEIEYIDRPSSHKNASQRFPLNIFSITDLPGFLKYVKAEHSIEYSEIEVESDDEKQKIEEWLNKDDVNIFELWLRAKAADLIGKVDIEKTSKGFFHKFYRGIKNEENY